MSASSPDERCFRCQTALPPHAVYCVDCGTSQLGTTDSGTVVTRSPYEPRPPQEPPPAVTAETDEPPEPAAVLEAVPEESTQPLASGELELIGEPSGPHEITGRYDLRALQRLIALGPIDGAMPDTRDLPVVLEADPEPQPSREEPPEIVAGDIEVIDDEPTPDPHRPVLPEPAGPKMPYFVRPRVRRRGGELQPPELRWRPCAPARATVRTPRLAFAPEPGAPRAEWGKPAPNEQTQLSAMPPRPMPYWDAPPPGDTQVGPAPTDAR